MLNKRVIKYIACVVIVAYLSVCSGATVLAGQTHLTVNPQLFAQVANPASPRATTSEEGRALREIYLDKTQRLEAEMNSTRGSRNTLLTAAVASFLIGAGVIGGSRTVRGAVEDIPVDPDDPEEQDDLNTALDALDAVGGVGGGIVGVGGVCMLGYLIYTAVINSKQKKIDTLRSELDMRFETRGLTPEYLRRNESVAAVLDEIADTKKSAGTSRSVQGFFSRLAIGSILAGGFLVGLSSLTNEVVDEITIDEDDPDEVAARDDAIDQADNLQTTGLILLGAGVTSGVISFFFGRRAKSREKKIDEMENSLLRVAERIHIQPTSDGVMVMYTHEF